MLSFVVTAAAVVREGGGGGGPVSEGLRWVRARHQGLERDAVGCEGHRNTTVGPVHASGLPSGILEASV